MLSLEMLCKFHSQLWRGGAPGSSPPPPPQGLRPVEGNQQLPRLQHFALLKKIKSPHTPDPLGWFKFCREHSTTAAAGPLQSKPLEPPVAKCPFSLKTYKKPHRRISQGGQVGSGRPPPHPLESEKTEFQGKSNVFSGQNDTLDCSKPI